MKWYRRHNRPAGANKTHHHNHHHHHHHKGDGHKSVLRSGRINPIVQSKLRPEPTYITAHVNFFDSNADESWQSNRFGAATAHRTDKWPHLTRLHSQLHQDMLGDSLPPYIKKYNRRNKQLIGLLEGQGLANADGDPERRGKPAPALSGEQHQQPPHHTDHERWIETNLFEAQLGDSTPANRTKATAPAAYAVPPSIVLNSKQRYLDEKNIQHEPNDLPGEHLAISAEDPRKCDDDDLCVTATRDVKPRTQKLLSPREKLINEGIISPRADSFLFHRVATPKVVGTAAGGQQKLPFVALTERIEDGTRQRRTNIVQNRFPLP